MRSTAILSDMAETATTTPARKLAGEIMLEEVARLPGRNKTEQFLDVSGLSRSTLRNIRSGRESVSHLTFWSAAAALNLPTHFFDFIIDTDAEKIRQLPGVREDLRQHVLDRLGQIELPRTRRATDRRRRA